MKNNTKICIIGLGRFGSLAASILKKYFEVSAIDTNQEDAKTRAKKIGIKLAKSQDINSFDIIILSAPISKTEEIIKKIAPKIKDGVLLIDTCSVKTLPCQWMKKHTPKNVEILGTHPMFGPTTSRFDINNQSWQVKGLQIILCPVRISQKRLSCVKSFLKKLKLEVIETTPQDHDRQNAKTLALVHFIGRALVASDVKKQQIFTPGYADLLNIIPHTASDNWQLFYDMNNFNPFAKEIREKFVQNCDELDLKIEQSKSSGKLEALRSAISRIDARIFRLFKKRFEIVKKIGRLKKSNHMPIKDKKREKELISKMSKRHKLALPFVESIYKTIFRQSINIQKKDAIKKNK